MSCPSLHGSIPDRHCPQRPHCLCDIFYSCERPCHLLALRLYTQCDIVERVRPELEIFREVAAGTGNLSTRFSWHGSGFTLGNVIKYYFILLNSFRDGSLMTTSRITRKPRPSRHGRRARVRVGATTLAAKRRNQSLALTPRLSPFSEARPCSSSP